MNKERVQTAVDHNARRLVEQLHTDFQSDVEWQMKSIKRLLEEKEKLSRLYHEIPHVTMDMEEQMADYMEFLNEQICKIINIKYKKNLKL